MGCQRGNYSDYCVKDVVRKILDAQRRATDEDSYSCATSCERSIDDLLSPDRHFRPTRYTTIPFMLICKDSCKPFVGSGFTSRRGRRGGRRGHFHCVESPVFKVKGFKRGSDSCVTLELLAPVHDHYGGDHHHDDCDDDFDGDRHHDDYDGHGGHDDYDGYSGKGGSFCGGFGDRRIDNFRYTGVCITVDLDCFCGISCLDPIRPDSMCH